MKNLTKTKRKDKEEEGTQPTTACTDDCCISLAAETYLPTKAANTCVLSTSAEYSFSSRHVTADALQQQPSHHASRHGPVYTTRPRVTSIVCTDITKRLKRQSTAVVAT